MASNSAKKKSAAGTKKTAATTNKKTSTGSRRSTSTKTAASVSRKKTTAQAKSSSARSATQANESGRNTPSGNAANPLLAREALLWLVLAVCVFMFISFFGVGGYVGTVISDFCFGIFGISAYVFPVLLFLSAAFLISNRGSRLAGEKFGACVMLYLCICCFAGLLEGSYTEAYDIGRLYARCASMKQGGGVVGGTICHFLAPALGPVGMSVLLIVFALIALVMITQRSLIGGVKKQSSRMVRSAKESSARRREERKRQQEWDLFEEMSEPVPETQERDEREERSRRGAKKETNRIVVREEVPFIPQMETGSASASAQSGTDLGGDMELLSVDRLRTGHPAPVPENRQLDVSVMFSGPTEPRRKHRHASGVTRNTKIVGSDARVGAEVHEILPKAFDPAAFEKDHADSADDRSYYIDLDADMEGKGRRVPDSTKLDEALPAESRADETYPDMSALHIEGVEPPDSSEPESTHTTTSAVFDAFVKSEESLGNRTSIDRNRSAGENPENADYLDGEEPMDAGQRGKSSAERVRGLAGASTQPEHSSGGQSRKRGSPERAESLHTEETAPDADEQEAASGQSAGPASGKIKRNPRSSEQEIAAGIASVEAEAAAKEAETPPRPEYVFPPLDLLKKGKSKNNAGQDQEIRQTAAKLQQTLNSFGVHVTVTNVSCGPSVTRYELLPEQGVKVSRIVSLADDIKLNLAAADIRIEAPIPGKSAVGIEVPNAENTTVPLRDLLESEEFQKHKSKLAFATGKDLGGKVVVSDIAKMPHLLIAGATGSGKSVCINTIIMSILYKAKPEEVKLIMIDPKVVELSVYNGIPHLFIPVVTDPKKAAGALNWGVAEMTDRYAKFAEVGARDLKGYNQKIEALRDVDDPNKPQKLPQIVIIVDELADLMMVAPGEVEDSICRLAQLARAAGIHLIIATQRPSVNVITGLIKANMPSRIAFSVSSGVDSRTIIDMYGAEKLLGKGDMLFYPQGYQKPARVQGAFVSDEEVSDVVDFLKNSNGGFSYDPEMEQKIAKAQQSAAIAQNGGSDTDELFTQAGQFIIEKDKASIGMLQRVFKIGFNRAARIMDQLSDAGVVGPEEGTKPRKILMSKEQFENYLENN
ncbi:MAG: DNA translocase FtsK [Lachnospiraceae bacterium]|nr:DNA translocase FtsK [Lachnospiraceae bacterium]